MSKGTFQSVVKLCCTADPTIAFFIKRHLAPKSMGERIIILIWCETLKSTGTANMSHNMGSLSLEMLTVMLTGLKSQQRHFDIRLYSCNKSPGCVVGLTVIFSHDGHH